MTVDEKNMLKHMQEHIDIFMCPFCEGDVKIRGNIITCLNCKKQYPVESGIPLMFYQDESEEKPVTDRVKEFYEETPFPNYDGFENAGDLIQRANRSVFARLLNEQTPFNIRVLEVGCGTGQLSNFLGIAHRHVFGVDMSLASLALGQEFKNRNNLERVGFYQMNLYKPIFKDESFPLVFSNGVLPAVQDQFGGFKSISRLVKKGGYIIIGLYNQFGRLLTDMRRLIFNASGNRFLFLDPNLRSENMGDAKKRAWFMDQYKHPQELKNTMGEVLKWFKETGFEYIYGIPNPKAFEGLKSNEKLFAKHSPGSSLDHFLVQSYMIFTGSREGGFFIMIGRKMR